MFFKDVTRSNFSLLRVYVLKGLAGNTAWVLPQNKNEVITEHISN